MVEDIVDELWPEIEQQVIFELRIKKQKPFISKPRDKKICFLCWPWELLKRWYLYTKFPYNKSIWSMMRTCSWWILLIPNLIPFYAV